MDGQTDRQTAVSTDILQDVNVSQPATKNEIVAGQNWGRVREKSMRARTHTHTQIIKICGFRDDSWEGGSAEFALCY
jgi:hypothetical protein